MGRIRSSFENDFFSLQISEIVSFSKMSNLLNTSIDQLVQLVQFARETLIHLLERISVFYDF